MDAGKEKGKKEAIFYQNLVERGGRRIPSLEAIISSTARCKDFSFGDSDELDETHRGYLPLILSCIEETTNTACCWRITREETREGERWKQTRLAAG
jgi:hypothetical protein